MQPDMLPSVYINIVYFYLLFSLQKQKRMKNQILLVFCLFFATKNDSLASAISDFRHNEFSTLFPFTLVSNPSENPKNKPAAACNVDNLMITEVVSCDGEGFTLRFDFTAQDFGAEGFTFAVLDSWTGSYELGDEYIFTYYSKCTEDITFIIYDNMNPSCTDTVIWEPACCPCLFEFDVDQDVCENGVFDVNFDLFVSSGSCLWEWEDAVFTVNGTPYEYTYTGPGNNYRVQNIQSAEQNNVYRFTFPLPSGEFREVVLPNHCIHECSVSNFTVTMDTALCSGEFITMLFDFSSFAFGHNGYTITTNYGDEFNFGLNDNRTFQLIADCINDYVFTITDQNNPDCSAEYTVGQVCCPCSGEYYISDETSCTNGTFDAYHRFEYNSGSCFAHDWTLKINGQEESFIWINGNTFLINDISFPDSQLVYEFCSSSPNGGCFYISAPNPCYQTASDCSMVFEEADTMACINDSIILSLKIYGQGQDFSQQGYNVQLNDSMFTWLNYEADSTYTLTLPDSGDSTFYLKICNNLNENCCFEKVFENPCFAPNTDCSLVFEAIEPPVCVNDSLITSVIIIGQNLSQTGFDVFLNDTFVVFMPYEADSIYTLLLPDPGTQNFILTICDTSQAGCCNEREFINPCYTSPDSCSLVFEEIGNAVCDSNFFNLSMIIAGTDISQTGFDVYLNGTILTFLLYQQDSTYQFVVPDPGTPWYHLTICDNDNELCCYTKELPNPCYEPNIDCSLFFENISAPICNQDSVEFSLFISGQNLSQTGFDVFVDGRLTAEPTFEADSLYELILPDIESDSLVLTICDDNNPGCCYRRTIHNPCFDPQGSCAISLEVTGDLLCENSTINSSVMVSAQHTSSTGFDIFVNDSLAGFWPFSVDSVYQLNIPDPFTDEISIVICDHGNAACCTGRLIENPCFTQGLCIVNNFSASAVKTTGDSLLVSGRFDQTDDCPANIPAVFTLNGGDSLLTDCIDGFFQFTHPGVETDSIYLEACLRLEFDTCLQIILPNPLISDLKTNTENALIFRQSTEEIMIVNPGKLFYEWQLFDIASGRIAGNFSNQNENIISIQNLPSGLYFIVLKQDQQVYVHKILHITK